MSSHESEDRGQYDPLRLYLNQVGHTKLLTPQQEITLARLIKKKNRKAREQMIKANLRLVVTIARDYQEFGLPLLDLIGVGNVGLIKAVERFDPDSRGAKLSTCAAWWIRAEIKRALAKQSRTIRLPEYLIGRLSRLRSAEVKLSEMLGQEPTEEELAYELGITPEYVGRMRSASQRTVSLHTPKGEGSYSLEDSTPDPQAENPAAVLQGKLLRDLMSGLLEKLDTQEKSILRRAFGLDGDPETLQSIKKDYGVTGERIRQIKEGALLKLREQFLALGEMYPVGSCARFKTKRRGPNTLSTPTFTFRIPPRGEARSLSERIRQKKSALGKYSPHNKQSFLELGDDLLRLLSILCGIDQTLICTKASRVTHAQVTAILLLCDHHIPRVSVARRLNLTENIVSRWYMAMSKTAKGTHPFAVAYQRLLQELT